MVIEQLTGSKTGVISNADPHINCLEIVRAILSLGNSIINDLITVFPSVVA